jgi:hypothetical protein
MDKMPPMSEKSKKIVLLLYLLLTLQQLAVQTDKDKKAEAIYTACGANDLTRR